MCGSPCPPLPRRSCNTPAVLELLGEGGMTEKNLMQYLGIVEQRTNEILQVGDWRGWTGIAGVLAGVRLCAERGFASRSRVTVAPA